MRAIAAKHGHTIGSGDPSAAAPVSKKATAVPVSTTQPKPATPKATPKPATPKAYPPLPVSAENPDLVKFATSLVRGSQLTPIQREKTVKRIADLMAEIRFVEDHFTSLPKAYEVTGVEPPTHHMMVFMRGRGDTTERYMRETLPDRVRDVRKNKPASFRFFNLTLEVQENKYIPAAAMLRQYLEIQKNAAPEERERNRASTPKPTKAQLAELGPMSVPLPSSIDMFMPEDVRNIVRSGTRVEKSLTRSFLSIHRPD